MKEAKGLKINTNNQCSVFTLPDLGFPSLKSVVKYTFAIVRIEMLDDLVMFVDDEGFINQSEFNIAGTLFYGQHLFGDVFIFREELTDEGYEVVSLRDGDVLRVKEALKNLWKWV